MHQLYSWSKILPSVQRCPESPGTKRQFGKLQSAELTSKLRHPFGTINGKTCHLPMIKLLIETTWQKFEAPSLLPSDHSAGLHWRCLWCPEGLFQTFPFFAMKKTWSVICYTHSSVETVERTLLPKCPRSNLLSPSTILYPACLPWLHPIIFEFRKNCEPIWATKLRKHNELSCNVSSKSGILWNIIHCYAK